MASIVGVIYAVLLAFIAVAAWENFNRAGDVTMKEATKLGDLYRASRLLSPAVSTGIDRLAEDYVRTGLAEERPAMAPGPRVGTRAWLLVGQFAGTVVNGPPANR